MSIKCKEGVHHSYISCICYHMMAFSNLRRHQHKTLFAGVCRRLSTMFPRLFGSYKVIFTKKLFFVKCKKILSQSFKCCVFCARVEDSRLNPGHVLKTSVNWWQTIQKEEENFLRKNFWLIGSSIWSTAASDQ